MRKTIHLCQRGTQPIKCMACGESAEVGNHPRIATPAVCYNGNDWNTIYKNHNDYRRCIDSPDERDNPKLKRFPMPENPGYYWAEWRIIEDGSFPGQPQYDDKPAPGLYVVEVWDDMDGETSNLQADVPGCAVAQPLENFLWRSERLEPPKGDN
jgi:hypothetical protein